MTNVNKVIRIVLNKESEVKLYKRPNGGFFIVKRDFNGKILKSNMNIPYGNNHTINRHNAVNLLIGF